MKQHADMVKMHKDTDLAEFELERISALDHLFMVNDHNRS